MIAGTASTSVYRWGAYTTGNGGATMSSGNKEDQQNSPTSGIGENKCVFEHGRKELTGWGGKFSQSLRD